jgi:hypothetical protein
LLPAVAMETTLHRDLKTLYGGEDVQFEVPLGPHRIDVVSGGRLVEIQVASLAAIRDKIRILLKEHRVVVVKPIIVRKTLVKRVKEDGPVGSRRLSPKRGTILDLFDELVHFSRVFPHHRLTLEVPLIDVEEWRYPGHGRRRRWRQNDYQVEDQKLIAVHQTHCFRTAADLARLITCPLPRPFHTGQLAESLGVDRWIAQRIAYCLRQTHAVREVGKQGNARLYEFTAARKVA